jgi:hypothetical protein
LPNKRSTCYSKKERKYVNYVWQRGKDKHTYRLFPTDRLEFEYATLGVHLLSLLTETPAREEEREKQITER